MFNYLFGATTGGELTSEPWLRAILVTYAFTTLLGLAIWAYTPILHLAALVRPRLSRRRGRPVHADDAPGRQLAREQRSRLGQALFWMGVASLLVAGFFSQGALFNRRVWLWLMLLGIYALLVFVLYYYYTRYQQLLAAQRAEAQRRKRYIPAPHTLGRGSSRRQVRLEKERRRE